MTAGRSRPGTVSQRGGIGKGGPPLTRREREILGLLANGMSGAEIAARLVLSPETVRTHVRNAMAKLGASTRSQAVVLAMQRREISAEDARSPRIGARVPPAGAAVAALEAMLDGLVSLYDLDGGAVYLADENGLSLWRATRAGAGGGADLPDSVALGDGSLGKVALERRAQLVHARTPGAGYGVVAAPMLNSGDLVGMIALEVRLSRPIGRSELLLLQAFANRVAEVLAAGTDMGRRLDRSLKQFRSTWAASGRR